MSTPSIIENSADTGGMLPGSSEQQPLQDVEHESVVGPPSLINVPKPEDMSCASSITTHFQDAELFVPHMYPSVQNLHDTNDVDDHPTFEPVTLQPRGRTTTTAPKALPPLSEESPQDAADSQDIISSHQQIDKIRTLKEQEKTTINDAPSMESLESKINRKTNIYSVRQISFETDGDTNNCIDTDIQKKRGEDEVADQNELHVAPDSPTANESLPYTDGYNKFISRTLSAATQDDTAPSPSPTVIPLAKKRGDHTTSWGMHKDPAMLNCGKEHSENEMARNPNELSTAGQKFDSTIQSNEKSNPATSETALAVTEGGTSSPLPNYIQEMPKPVATRSIPATRTNEEHESRPGAHAVQLSRFTEQTHQPSSGGGSNTDAEHAEETREDMQPPPPESLAEARPVAEDDLPVATVDTGNNNSQKRSNWPFFIMGGIFGVLVFASIIVGAVCGTGHCSHKVYVDGSTLAPTTTRDAVAAPEMETVLKTVLGRDYFKQVEKYGDDLDVDLAEVMLETRLRAFDWIVNHDPMQLEYDSPNLVQRFLLVLFYYQTTRHKPWKVCNPGATNQRSSTTNFCYQIHPVTGDITLDIWDDQWLSDSHECQWAGVICENAQSEEMAVTDLSLGRNHLNGPLPWEITRMPLLGILRLENNMLTGTLPPRLFSKKAGSGLETLVLSSNQFSGTIPAEWVADLLEGSGKLTLLVLNRNTLTGMIPSELGLLSLKSLILRSNTLTGSIPQEVFNQTALQRLYLGQNDLTGTLPSEVGLLTNLKYLNLNYAQISGTLPSEIGLLNQCEELVLSNTNMQGTIPEELYTGLNPGYLYLDGSSFSGTISPSLGLLTNLIRLGLASNHFHGTIPNEIDALTLLTELLVNGNDLSGTVPVSFCHNLYAGETGSKVVADCLPNSESGVPVIQCPSDCCTSCCDETGVCLAT